MSKFQILWNYTRKKNGEIVIAEEELQKMADAYKMELDKVKSLMDDAAIDQMKDDLAIQAAVDLVRDAAKEVEAKEEEKSEEA